MTKANESRGDLTQQTDSRFHKNGLKVQKKQTATFFYWSPRETHIRVTHKADSKETNARPKGRGRKFCVPNQTGRAIKSFQYKFWVNVLIDFSGSVRPATGGVTGQVWRRLRLNQSTSSPELCEVWLVAAATLRPRVTRVPGVSAGFCLFFQRVLTPLAVLACRFRIPPSLVSDGQKVPADPVSFQRGAWRRRRSSAHELKSVTDTQAGFQKEMSSVIN